MSVTVTDIQRHLAYGAVEQKLVQVGVAPPREPEVVAVTFILDLVNCGPIPYESVEHNVKQAHGVNEHDRLLRYGVDSIEDGVDLCRDLCAAYGLPFNGEQEEKLRRGARSGEKLLLFVIERPLIR